MFFGLAAYVSYYTLPYLLSIKLYDQIKLSVADPPSFEHFTVVMIVFWLMLTATSSGFISRTWHRSLQASQRQLDAERSG